MRSEVRLGEVRSEVRSEVSEVSEDFAVQCSAMQCRAVQCMAWHGMAPWFDSSAELSARMLHTL